MLKKELPNKDDEIDNIIRSFKAEKNKIDVLYRNLPNKRESEIKNIAESINRIQVDIGKVLLLGSAGIGKTTLMHYLSYKWGKKELWNDKFDYVFRIKLKELLNESWKDGYSGYFDINNLFQSKLNCFIHYCLGGSESTLSVKEIMDIQNKDKMLLLLDGYDEVAHLNTRDEFKKLIDKILEYKNVIMTSRPNAVVEEMSNRFERKVENIGWDSEGIEQYVNKNFENDKELGAQLTSFLNTHSQIKEICKVPISTALICLVWSDKDIRDKFQKNSDEDFNISRLYSEITDWLNNRHLAKTQHKYKNKTDANNHLKNIMSFLEHIAYESLIATGKLVERKLVEDKKDTLDIDEVIEQGLLKIEGKNFQFIHLTLQEYLAACYLENQLLDNHTKSEKAAFIGEHRNEPKYLMTLKFLAGMVSNDDKQESTEIFWETVTCNVDGILELGIERKTILLMHLLAQSKINGKFDNRIPHLRQIQKLIDDIVLKDITIWEQHIIDSGYLSEEIIKTVNEKLQNKQTTSQELKTATEIIVSLANRIEWGSKTKVYEKLIGLLEVDDTQLQKIVLQKLAQILDETIDEKIVRKSLDKILFLLNIGELNEYVNIILIKVINIMPDLDEEILKQQKILNSRILLDNIINETIRSLPSSAEKEFKEIEELFREFNNDNIKLIAALNLIQIVPLKEAIAILENYITNPDIDNYTKSAVVVGLVEVIKTKPNLAEEIFKTLKQLFINPKTDIRIKSTIAVTLIKILKAMSIAPAFRAFNELTGIPKVDKHMKYKAITSLVEIVKEIPVDGVNYMNINELLKIIDLTKTKDHYEELYLEVKNTLQKITPYITQEYEKSKNPEVIEWFTESFNELPNINETRIFLKEICKSILKSGVINEYESKFILSCIKKYNFTFTVSVSKEQGIEGKIIFEDRSYEIFTTDNSASKIVSLEEFATKLLAETNDPLAEQYKTHKPLFPNKGLALKIAASDINYVSSIANENEKLSTEKYLLSYAGDNKDKFVMLLEKRSIFGDHLIYKLDKDNHNFEKIAATYPDEIDKDIEEQLFEELDFEKLFEYVVRNNSLNSEEEKQIFKHPDKLKFVSEIMKKDGARTINFKLPKHDTHKRLDIHEKILSDHNKTLKDSRTIQKAEINRKVESLTQESPLLYDYCNALYYYIKNTINAIQIAETKIFKNNINEKEAIIKMLAKGIGLITQNLLIDILTDLACSIIEARRERKHGNKVTSMDDIIRNIIGMENLDDCLKKIAIIKTQERKNEIINLPQTPVSNSLKSQNKIKKLSNAVKEFVFPKAIERYDKDNIAVQLALKDSILFIESLYTNRDDILNKKSDLFFRNVYRT